MGWGNTDVESKYTVIGENSCGSHVVRLDAPYYSDVGNAVMVPMPRLVGAADTKEETTKSPLVICENGVPLALGHADHIDIFDAGMGRYSHFGQYIRFSASDNSNPNTNGRTYEVALNDDHLGSLINGPVDRVLLQDEAIHAIIAIAFATILAALSARGNAKSQRGTKLS